MSAGPYRAEFGAIYHEAAPGFLFTVSPAATAEHLARQLNNGVVRPAPVAETAGEAVRWLVEWPINGLLTTECFEDEAKARVFATHIDLSDAAHPLPASHHGRVIPLYAAPVPAQDDDKLREATGAQAVIRDERIVISIDVDALPGILSGSIATNSVAGLFKVTDPTEFAKEVCGALNAEKEDGTTRVHMMFDSAFNHAIDQGAEGVEEITEAEFEAEAQRIQSEALVALQSTAAQEGGAPQGDDAQVTG